MTDVAGADQEQKRRPETMWKLVDAKCVQLADAVKQARPPFLLAILWGFMWATAIYTHDFGYTNILLTRYEKILAQVAVPGANACETLMKSPLKRYHLDELAKADSKECMKAIEDGYKHLGKQQIDQWSLNLPGLVARVTVFDLGIVGQFGLLLLLIWFFFAARRERSAIRSFVDIAEDSEREKWIPRKFTLMPMEQFLSAEHYAYAYQAVSERFLFILSTKSQPLMAITVLLVAFPAIVAGCNVYTDLRDIDYLELYKAADPLLVRVMIEWILFGGILAFTTESIKYSIQTGVLLNAWGLANTEWEKHWDERNLDPTPAVSIDRTVQRARLFILSATEISSAPAPIHGDMGSTVKRGPGR